jgi:hypothetical protein
VTAPAPGRTRCGAVAVLVAAVALPASAQEQAAAGEPGGTDPEFVRPLVPVAAGRNDSNPVWSPSGDMVALERSRGDDKNRGRAPNGESSRPCITRLKLRPERTVLLPGVVGRRLQLRHQLVAGRQRFVFEAAAASN